MIEFKTDKPTKTALYLVDRGMQGKYYRWYDADTDKWGMCGSDMNEALEFMHRESPIGFVKWMGPLTGPNIKLDRPLPVIETDESPKSTKVKKQSKRLAKQTGSKLVESNTKSSTKVVKPAKSVTTKVVHPDGTVFYRADRNKWVAMWNQKQEAARPTAEACLAFLKKKYNVTGKVIK